MKRGRLVGGLAPGDLLAHLRFAGLVCSLLRLLLPTIQTETFDSPAAKYDGRRFGYQRGF